MTTRAIDLRLPDPERRLAAALATAWRDFLYAWGEVRASDLLGRDDTGRYVIRADGTTPL